MKFQRRHHTGSHEIVTVTTTSYPKDMKEKEKRYEFLD